MLAHIIDLSQPKRDPVEDFKTIRRELELFNPDLLNRTQIVIASKMGCPGRSGPIIPAETHVFPPQACLSCDISRDGTGSA
ncbi:MAG: hypothetical protein MZV64_34485 [Ignavibacteriales bacterium]|nr:hypothetical protein [Ignavibacteriales bacterium]